MEKIINQVTALIEAYDRKITDRTAKNAETRLINFANSLSGCSNLRKSTLTRIAIEVFNK